jgi:hypothetical protein
MRFPSGLVQPGRNYSTGFDSSDPLLVESARMSQPFGEHFHRRRGTFRIFKALTSRTHQKHWYRNSI